ncbi:MAG TPA: hypothetical protein PLI95_16255 [Polyangiaceae bacterium]|nr:hypothetical protein [Polyangiaceae bacterium]
MAGPPRLSGPNWNSYVTITVPLSGTGKAGLPTEVSVSAHASDIKKKSAELYPDWAPTGWTYNDSGMLTADYDSQDTWAYFSGKIDVSATQDGCTYALSIPIDFTHVDKNCSTRADCNNAVTDLCEGAVCVKPECVTNPFGADFWGTLYADCTCRVLGGIGGVCADKWCDSSELVNGSCAIGQICDHGTCVAPGPALVGASCASTMTDGGCEAGALCDAGTCRWACLVGEPGPHCPAGDVCNGGVCKAASGFAALGAPCSVPGSACGPCCDTLIGFCDGGVRVLRCDDTPSWSQKDLGCAKYSTSDTVAASVAFHVTAGQKYGVTTSNTSISATDITVNRTGP